jgi:antitoxin CptB
MESTAVRRKRLAHRGRDRGFLESDLIFARFIERHLPGLDDGQLDRFEALVDEPDEDVWAWVIGRRPVPARHDNDVMALLRLVGGAA